MRTSRTWQYALALVVGVGVGTLMIGLGFGDGSVWIGAVAFAISLIRRMVGEAPAAQLSSLQCARFCFGRDARP